MTPRLESWKGLEKLEFQISLKISLSELSHTELLFVITINISQGTRPLAVCGQKTKAGKTPYSFSPQWLI